MFFAKTFPIEYKREKKLKIAWYLHQHFIPKRLSCDITPAWRRFMPSKVDLVASKTKPRFSVNWNDILLRAVLPILAMLCAFIIGAVVLLLLKVNPFVAYASIFTGVFGSMAGFTQSLVKATPLLYGRIGYLHRFSSQCNQYWSRRPNYTRSTWSNQLGIVLPNLASLAAHANHFDHEFHYRLIMGFYSRPP